MDTLFDRAIRQPLPADGGAVRPVRANRPRPEAASCHADPPASAPCPASAAPAAAAGWRAGLPTAAEPWLGNQCRFEPTCSRYALEALERHGAAAGSYLAVVRIARAPWCTGGCDPVPVERPRLFRHLLSGATVPVDPPWPPARLTRPRQPSRRPSFP
jgi:putative membrane protein insertion efficiency factor